MPSVLARASLTLLLLAIGAVTVVFGVFRVNDIMAALATGAQRDPFDARYVAHPLPSFVHIALGTAFMVIGPLQFVPAIRRRWGGLHRWLGRVFVLAGLVVGGSALYMAAAFPAYGGLTTQAANAFFGSYFVLALLLAFAYARRRRFRAHRAWMIRAYALGLAVSTIRLYILLLQVGLGYRFEEAFGVGFWLGFSTHALAAEVIVNRTRQAPARPTEASRPRV